MNVVYVIRSLGHFAYYESIIRDLCHRGHRVKLLFVPNGKKCDHKGSYHSDQAVRACEAQTPGLEVGHALRRKVRRDALFAWRELRTYASYLRRPDQSSFYLKRWEGLLPPVFQRSPLACAAAGLGVLLVPALPRPHRVGVGLGSRHPRAVDASSCRRGRSRAGQPAVLR